MDFNFFLFYLVMESKREDSLTPPGNDEYYVEDKYVQTEEDINMILIDDVQEVTKGLGNLKTATNEAEPMDSSSPIVMIIAPFLMPRTILDPEESGIQWVGLPNESIDSVTNRILEELKEKDPQKPKWITVCAYQPYTIVHSSALIEKHLAKITRAAMDSKLHKLSLATFYHIPSQEKFWDRISMLNQHLRLMNLDMGRTPNNVHKGLLFSWNKGRVTYIRHSCWTERMNMTGVGSTLNAEGLSRYKNFLLKNIHEGGFKDLGDQLIRATGGDGSPAPLFLTKGYKGNEKMMGFIEARAKNAD